MTDGAAESVLTGKAAAVSEAVAAGRAGDVTMLVAAVAVGFSDIVDEMTLAGDVSGDSLDAGAMGF